MPHLLDLPNELLALILDFVDSLYNCCLVSRKLRDLTQSIMFRDFTEYGRGMNRTVAFVRTVTVSPQLGQYVHLVDLPSLEMDWDDLDSDDLSPLSPEEIDLFTRAIRDLKLGDEEGAWLSAMKKTDRSIFLALLLSKVPNIRRLSFPGDQIYMEPFRALFARQPSFLSNLVDLRIKEGDVFDGYDVGEYAAFLTLPNVSAVDVVCGHILDCEFPDTWSPGSLGLDSIAFTMCRIEENSMQKLMQACKKLKEFTYSKFTCNIPSPTPELTAPQLIDALAPHKKTLKALHIQFANSKYEFRADIVDDESHQPKLPPLIDFPVLYHLTIQHSLLPTHPELPPSLEILVIEDCKTSIREMTHHFAAAVKANHFPLLKEIIVTAADISQPVGQDFSKRQTFTQCFSSLKDLFKGTQVDYCIIQLKLPGELSEDEDDDNDDWYSEKDSDYGEVIVVDSPE